MSTSKNAQNKNAQTWTLEKANDFIKNVYDYVLNNESCRSIGTACANLGSYETVLNYLEETEFSKNIDFEPIKVCKELVKSRLIEQGLDSKANATMAIFILKNNHGMADKQETKSEVTVKDFDITKVVKFKE